MRHCRGQNFLILNSKVGEMTSEASFAVATSLYITIMYLQGMLLTLPLLDGLGRPRRGVIGTIMASLSDDRNLLSIFTVPRTYSNYAFISKSSSFCSFRFRKFRSD